MRINIFVILSALTLCLISSPAFAGSSDITEKAFTVTSGGTLKVDADLGSVEIRTAQENRITVQIERTANGVEDSQVAKVLADIQTEFSPNEKGLLVKVTYAHEVPGDSSRLPVWVKLKISVPQQYNLDLDTGRGNIKVAGANGTLNAWTRGGNIELEDVLGKVEAKTAGGHVTARMSVQPTDGYRLVTSGGHVDLYLAPKVAIKLDAVTGGGHVTSELDQSVKSKLGASLREEINGGGPAIVLRSGGGNIGLHRLDESPGR